MSKKGIDYIALIGITVIIFYIFGEVLKYNDLEPMDFSIFYIIYILFTGLIVFVPNPTVLKKINIF